MRLVVGQPLGDRLARRRVLVAVDACQVVEHAFALVGKRLLDVDEVTPRVRQALGDDDREGVAPVARQRVADLHGCGQPRRSRVEYVTDVLPCVLAAAAVDRDLVAVDTRDDPGCIRAGALAVCLALFSRRQARIFTPVSSA